MERLWPPRRGARLEHRLAFRALGILARFLRRIGTDGDAHLHLEGDRDRNQTHHRHCLLMVTPGVSFSYGGGGLGVSDGFDLAF